MILTYRYKLMPSKAQYRALASSSLSSGSGFDESLKASRAFMKLSAAEASSLKERRA